MGNKGTKLMANITFGNNEEAKRMIKEDKELIKFRDESGYTPLCWLVHYGQLDMVKFIINLVEKEEIKEIVNVQSINGHYPLYIAGYNNHPHIVEYLLQNGADPNPNITDPLKHPLFMPCYKNYINIVKILLKYGCMPNLDSLVIACVEGNTEIIKLLLNHGAKKFINTHCHFGPPIHYAIKHKQIETVRLLIDNGAYINSQDLQYAIEQAEYPNYEILKILIINANVDNNLIKFAIEKNYNEIANLLIISKLFNADVLSIIFKFV